MMEPKTRLEEAKGLDRRSSEASETESTSNRNFPTSMYLAAPFHSCDTNIYNLCANHHLHGNQPDLNPFPPTGVDDPICI